MGRLQLDPDALRWAALAAGATWALTPHATPAAALAIGLLLAVLGANPSHRFAEGASKSLLKVSIVGLGFGIPLHVVMEAGGRGILYGAAAVLVAVPLGLVLARSARIDAAIAWLVTIGTAICGGSAIAALAPVIRARAASIAVSLGIVFILNAVALYAFPPVAAHLGLTQGQFATWAALAIHDTASVVGAAATYGPQALSEATILKLSRILWLVPLVLAAAWLLARRERGTSTPTTRAAFPVFIVLFLAAATLRTLIPAGLDWYETAAFAARRGLVAALFLVGLSLRPSAIAQVGARPFLFGLSLWLAVASLWLAAAAWIE